MQTSPLLSLNAEQESLAIHSGCCCTANLTASFTLLQHQNDYPQHDNKTFLPSLRFFFSADEIFPHCKINLETHILLWQLTIRNRQAKIHIFTDFSKKANLAIVISVHYNVVTKHQHGLFVAQQTQGNLASTAAVGSRCWCAQWAHVRADPTGLSPGTPAECWQWLESCPWHLSQLDGIRHRCLCNVSWTRRLSVLNPFCTRCCQIWVVHILASTLSRLSLIDTPTFICTCEDVYSTPAWSLTGLPEGRGCHRNSRTLGTEGLISTQISNLPQALSYSKTFVRKSLLLSHRFTYLSCASPWKHLFDKLVSRIKGESAFFTFSHHQLLFSFSFFLDKLLVGRRCNNLSSLLRNIEILRMLQV